MKKRPLTHLELTVFCGATSITDDTLNDTLNDTLKLVLGLIQSHPGISANALIKETDKSVITIRRSVKTLTDADLIEYRGSKKTGGYFIKTYN